MLGGVIAANYGWRAAFFVAGVPGLLLAILLFFTVWEPTRERTDGANDRSASPSYLQTAAFVWRTATVFHAFIGIGLAALAMSGVPVWAATFLVRTEHFNLSQAGLIAGLGVGLFGTLGSLLGGPIGDRVVKRWGVQALPLVPMAASMIAAIAGVVFAEGSSFLIVAVGFIVFEVFSRAFTAPAYAMLVTGVEPRMRGVVVSAVQAVTNLVGYGGGPLIVGFVSDRVGGPNSLKLGISTVMFFSFWAGLHFLAAWFAGHRAAPATSDALA
jgi:predicted MFS family arabinose efflux permease